MTAVPGKANLAVACVFVDELARQGVRHAVVCPGSRSTPLALAFASHHDVRIWVQVDERSASYFALGMARQLESPVALVCTSGTAAANFHPAVAEASLARIPLIVLTADRPPELRGWGAAQTIEQSRLYGDHAKWFVEMPVPTLEEALVRHARATAARAMTTAMHQPAGPVHVNFPFREPLLPADMDPSADLADQFRQGQRESVPMVARASAGLPAPDAIAAVTELVAGSRRGIIVCGPSEGTGLAPAATALASAAGYPVLADPLSSVRFGAQDRSSVVDAYDAFLRDPDMASELRPDVVIRTGAIPTSKALQRFLAESTQADHVLIDPGEPRDADHLATTHLRADAEATLAALSTELGPLHVAPDANWLDRWTALDRTAGHTIARTTAANDEPFEGRALAETAAALPEGATLVVGNSMPVRDADTFIRGDYRELRIVANRGANGIDGVVSSALGAAAVAAGPVVLVIGDLSFYHDLNGLLAAKLHAIAATIIILNNDGGGIFSFLPQHSQLDQATFETLFGTPIGLDVASAARLYEASYSRPAGWRAFRRALCAAIAGSGVSIIELKTDREHNVAQHREIWDAVGQALQRSPAAS